MSKNIKYNVALSILSDSLSSEWKKKELLKYILRNKLNDVEKIENFFCYHRNKCNSTMPCRLCWETEIDKKYEWYKGLLQKLEAINE